MANKRKELRQLYYDKKGDLTEKEILAIAISTTTANADGELLADRLLKEFHSLNNIYKASPKRLMKVEGVSAITATYLSLHKELAKRMSLEKNKGITHLKNTNDAVPYFYNMLKEETMERIVMVTLNEKHKIISAKFVSEGTMNFAGVSAVAVTRIINEDKPRYVFIAHNHLNGSSKASMEDMHFTANIKAWLKGFDIELIDHIIISNKDAYSIIEGKQYPINID